MEKITASASQDGDTDVDSLLVRTPLINAILSSDIQLALELIASGADVNAKDEEGNTALMHAVLSNNIVIVPLLILRGAFVNAFNDNKQSALFLAVIKKSKDMVELLIRHGAEINVFCNLGGVDVITPLMRAAFDGNTEIINSLLKANANVNECGYMGSALFYALDTNNETVAELLIENGADVNASSENNHGLTILMYASDKGNTKIVKALLQAHANVNAFDNKGITALHVAIEKDRKEVVELLIDNGADVNQSRRNNKINGYKPLMDSARKGNVEIAKSLLKAGAHINAPDENGSTALFQAVRKDHKDMVKLLIENGADVNVSCKYGKINECSPLMVSSRKGNVEITRVLLQAGVHMDASNEHGQTALFQAVHTNNKTIVELLVERGAEVNVSCRYEDLEGITPLMCAVMIRNIEIVKILLQANCKVNATSAIGLTALYIAVYSDQKDISELLIKHNADVNMYCEQEIFKESTPLTCAAKNGNIEIVRALLQANANVNASGENRQTALFLAVDGRNKEIAELLIANGADINVSCKYGYASGYTPLMCAAKNGDIVIVRALLQAGANVNASYKAGETALFMAIDGNDNEIVQLLIERGAEIDATCKYGNASGFTPLMRAIKKGNIDIVKTLLQAGANIDKYDKYGQTALICATMIGHIEIVKELMQAHAHLNAPDKNGQTALLKAIMNNNRKMVELLIKNGADLNVYDVEGQSPLFSAVLNGNIELVLLLLENGADVDKVNKCGETVLHRLFQSKTCFNPDKTYPLDIIDALIKYSKDVNVRDSEGKTALHYAVQEELKETVQILIDAHANVNIRDIYGKTPLFYTTNHIDNIVLSLLVAAGANADVVDTNHETVLFDAVRKGNTKAIKALIVTGSIVSARNSYGRTPIFDAINGDCPLETARLLLDNGASLNDSDNWGLSVLSFYMEKLCCQGNLSEDKIKILEMFTTNKQPSNLIVFLASTILDVLKKDEQTNCIFSSAINILYNSLPKSIHHGDSWFTTKGIILSNAILLAGKYASNKQKQLLKDVLIGLYSDKAPEMIDLLTRLGTEMFDLHVNTAARPDKVPEVLDLLIQLGADPNSTDSDGNTALHHAALLPFFGASKELTKKLITTLYGHYGARFTNRNHDNQTPLMYGLSAWDNVDADANWLNFGAMKVMCEHMLEHGSLVNETTTNGKSVFHIFMGIFRSVLTKTDGELLSDILQDLISLLRLFGPPDIIPGVTVNRRDNELRSPLHLWASLSLKRNEVYTSSISGKLSFENLLKEIFDHLSVCGVTFNDRDGEDRTPLHYCRTWSAVKCLVKAKAKRNAYDFKGRPPLLTAANNKVFTSKEGCFFPDVTDEPKLFFHKCIEMDLDLWTYDNDGESILSWLLSSDCFVLANGLVEAACEWKPDVLNQLLLTLCKDKGRSIFWKSSLVGKILACRGHTPDMNLSSALRSCCINIKKLHDEGELEFENKNKANQQPDKLRDASVRANEYGSNASHISVHLDIARQLLIHGANGECCEDLCINFTDLHKFLTDDIDYNQAPLRIPWSSQCERHKEKLERVIRGQNFVSINAFWYHKEPIGSGTFGHVFAGISEKDGREVAIKKIEKLRMARPHDTREITILTALADCPQVVKYIFYFDDAQTDFAYIVLELMEGDLKEYFESQFYNAHSPSQSISLCRDLVVGVKYLHNHKPPILHRDLKPGNILFKVRPKVSLKIADFGLSSSLTSGASTVFGTNAGTRCWTAPEVMLSTPFHHTKESDNYSCGLLLHYIMSPQKHPFSPVDSTSKSREIIDIETGYNMMNNAMDGWDSNISPLATNLIQDLLSKEASDRISAADSLSHPFFWSNKKQLAFLCAVGNQPEIERPLPACGPLPPLESDIETSFATIVKYPTWDDARYTNMPAICAEMTKPVVRGKAPPKPARKYKTGSAIELIRFIRNAMAHVSEATRPPAVKQQILEDAVFLDYFPELLIRLYHIVAKHGWDTREEIKHILSSEDL